MRPTEFDSEKIIVAGQELQAAGCAVTSFAIRQKIGGGNAPRIKRVWEEYVSGQAATKAEPHAELPPEVADEVANVAQALTARLSGLAIELNDKAVKAAERRVADVLRGASEQREQAERELADAAQTVDDLESKLDEAAISASALENRLADAQAVGQKQAVELAQVRERLALTERAAEKSTQEHGAELARLNSGLLEAKKAAEAVAAERDRARAELTAELTTVKAKAEAADQSRQEQKKQAAAEAHRTAEHLAKVQSERDQARSEAGGAREEAARLAGQVETLQAQAKDLMSALAERAS
jgi:colicin import membrane protein